MNVFTRTAPGLKPVLDELMQLEPIFHNEAFGQARDAFAARMSGDYWEVGASGRRYSREFILNNAAQIAGSDAVHQGWSITGPGVRELGPQTYLFTYTLDQNGRITRRATIWQRTDGGWKILYHQGTVVVSQEDDTLPGPSQ